MAAPDAPMTRWLSIVGLGEDGIDGLTPLAGGLIEGAEIVFGGRRHLDFAASLVRGAVRPWPSPFSIDPVLAQRGRRVVVLASGDPMLHGVGATLMRAVPPAQTHVVPAPSSFSLAAARLGWPLQDCIQLSLHGRPIELIRPHLQSGARILALTSDQSGPAAVAALLTQDGFGPSAMTILEALGGPRERIRATTAADFTLTGVDPLNLLTIKVTALPGARILPRAPGLPDALFEHDGQISKRDIRALTISALAPRRGDLLWDIGAGSGSIGIEWMLADPTLRTVAIETRLDRADRVRRNALAFGVPDLRVVEGAAPQALAGLPAPEAIFIGGGASRPGMLDTVIGALRPGGRLVVNAITLETEALLLARHAALGGQLLRIAISRAAPVAGMTGWRPAMPVTQWTWEKPSETQA
ncbi:MAG: precorrin-6y C5,15-methyltransferase (decarboxylating) subunit CbiE [Rhodopila sp.]